MHPEADLRHLADCAFTEALESLPPAELADVGNAVAEHLAAEPLRHDPAATLNAPHLAFRPPPRPPEAVASSTVFSADDADDEDVVDADEPPFDWVVFEDEVGDTAAEDAAVGYAYAEPTPVADAAVAEPPPAALADLPDFRPPAVDVDFRLDAAAFAPPADTAPAAPTALPPAAVPEAEAMPTVPPSSWVDPLPPVTHAREFLVCWSGQAGPGGLAPDCFDVYVAIDDGPYTLWQSRTAAVSAVFQGDYGRRYRFYSVATDAAGNTETPPLAAQAETHLRRQPGSLRLARNGGLALDRFTVAVIARDQLQVRDAEFRPDQIRFTLTRPPRHGKLLLGHEPLDQGDVFSQADVDAEQLRYQHGGGRRPRDHFECVVDDGAGGVLDDVRFRIAVLPVRSAPVLDPNHAPRLRPVKPGAAAARGTRVAELLGDAVHLISPGAKPGIAVVGLTATADGDWQYSLDRGKTWLDFGEVYHGQARLLRAADRVRFVPHASFRGQARLAFRAWDRTDGAPGGKVNLTAADRSGGATAFSSALVTAVAHVAPRATTCQLTKPAFAPPRSPADGRTVASLVGIAGRAAAQTQGGVAVVGLHGHRHGTWQYSRDDGQTWLPFGEVFHGRALLLHAADRVRFLPRRPAALPAGAVTLTYRTWDGTTGKPGDRVNLASTNALRETAAFAAAAEILDWVC